MAGILHTKKYCLGLSFCRGFLWFASCLDIMFDDDTHVSSIYITLGHSECKGSKKETRPVGDCSLIFYSSFTSGFHKIPPNSCALLTIVIIY